MNHQSYCNMNNKQILSANIGGIFSYVMALAILFSSGCDYITNPVVTHSGNSALPTSPPTRVDSTSATDDALTKALVEDYTGHRCENCPAAAIQIDPLLTGVKAANIVLLQVNCTLTFGQGFPKNSFVGLPDTAYGIDYRITAGNNWNNTFINGDNNGLPGTMVDRLYYSPSAGAGGGNDLYLNVKNVSTPFDSLTATSPTASIHIIDSMWAPPTSFLAMNITTKLHNPQSGNTYWLVVCLAEDSIYDWQDSLNVNRQYYLKRMTLRKVINGNGSGWGDSLTHTTSPQTKYYTFTNDTLMLNNSMPISLPPKIPTRFWNMAHMYIVAFVYQQTPSGKPYDYMVLQAQKLHL